CLLLIHPFLDTGHRNRAASTGRCKVRPARKRIQDVLHSLCPKEKPSKATNRAQSHICCGRQWTPPPPLNRMAARGVTASAGASGSSSEPPRPEVEPSSRSLPRKAVPAT